MKKVLFIDRDGTLIVEPPVDYQVDSLEKLEFFPGVFQNLARIVRETDYLLVMVTNQDGLGTTSFPEETFWPVQNKMITAFRNEGIEFSEVLIDRSFPQDNAPTRKPGTAMLTHYMQGGYDLAGSFVIGDRLTDVQLAKNLGCRSVYMGDGECSDADFCTKKWDEVRRFISQRTATVSRKTGETDIEIFINLDGKGDADISTGLGFFDHMLEQIARHGRMDLRIRATGDLHVDEHHTIEDTGIVLGQAFVKALGSKRGIDRYGFLLPMDDCLAQVAIDLGGRSWLVWDVSFARERIGDVPTEMFYHFFRSFSDNALCNLNIKAEGQNEHHKIEAIFKAFARSLKMAVTKNANDVLPSTKGMI